MHYPGTVTSLGEHMYYRTKGQDWRSNRGGCARFDVPPVGGDHQLGSKGDVELVHRRAIAPLQQVAHLKDLKTKNGRQIRQTSTSANFERGQDKAAPRADPCARRSSSKRSKRWKVGRNVTYLGLKRSPRARRRRCRMSRSVRVGARSWRRHGADTPPRS